MEMKMKCSGCDKEEARVFCCADEAALCFACDEKIHAPNANSLVSNHQRVSLSSPSSSSRPKCDICQEMVGYFLCLEDRALLCRKCDVAIHTANSFVSDHRRFLLTGPKVGLEPPELLKSNSTGNGDSSAAAALLPQAAAVSDNANLAITGSLDSIVSSNRNYQSNCQGESESKADGNSEWWKILRSTEEELLNLNGDWTAEDASWRVPELFRQYSQRELVSSTETGGSSSNNNNDDVNINNGSNAAAAGSSPAAPAPAAAAAAASQCLQLDNSSVSTKRRRSCK